MTLEGHQQNQPPPLWHGSSKAVFYNYDKDGLWTAVTVGCDRIEAKGIDELDAMKNLLAMIAPMLPETHTDIEPEEIKSNELHLNWK